MSVRILIVDDNWDHGTAIKRALGLAGFKADFFFYDSSRVGSLPTDGGLRIVFSDLNLTGEGVHGDKDYATVTAVLEKVIPASNGPFALISWTTFGKEAEGLSEYVRKRAEAHCHPVEFAVIDKEGLIQEAAKEVLRDRVLAVFEKMPAIRAILEWETASMRALAAVVSRLEALPIADGNATFDKRLHQLFTKIAEAEGGDKAIDKKDITRPLTNVLARLLHDEVGKIAITPLPAHSDENLPTFTQQKGLLNTMLHVDSAPPSAGAIGSLPGLAFPWPVLGSEIPPGLPQPSDRALFVKEQFLNKKAESQSVDDFRLLMIDTTPTCDHSQNKIPWRRFVGAVLVPIAKKDWVKSANIGDGGNLRRTPELAMSEGVYWLVLNSNLTFAIPNQLPFLKLLGNPVFQVREQLMSDLLGWSGRQSSRLGYTYFE